jgi:NAD(P)-dependent dehydrogenase (short-subunit alcohol dehydrogenase family)
MPRLKNKVALISGGARGLGAAETRMFISEGTRVMIGDRIAGQRASSRQRSRYRILESAKAVRSDSFNYEKFRKLTGWQFPVGAV